MQIKLECKANLIFEGIARYTVGLFKVFHSGRPMALPANIRLGACTIKHYGFVIYGKCPDFVIS
jgi:hypothetical protein